MPATSLPPITTQKSAFLQHQIRALSAPLAIPPSAHTTLPSLSDKSLADLLSKANDKIKSHNRAAFSAQATRHIAEQIETLYWNEVRTEREATRNSSHQQGETTVKRDVDLTTFDGLAELGEAWTDILSAPKTAPPALTNDPATQSAAHSANTASPEADILEEPGDPEQAAHYATLLAQLHTLTQQRDAARDTLAQYRRLQTLLEPYEDAQQHIQPNLVTKDGELGRELEKMRALLARVTARMGEQKELQGQVVSAASAGDEAGGAEAFDERLRAALDVQ